MRYRALALDVDGTLISAAQKKISASTTEALKNLQSRGVTVILATGRSGFASVGSILGTDFLPDWRVCANGAQILDRFGCCLQEKRFTSQDVDRITGFVLLHDLPLTFTFEDAYYVYNKYEEYIDFYTSRAGPVPYLYDGSSHDRHRQSLPFGAYIIKMPGRLGAELAGVCPSIKLMETNPDAFDVSPGDADKRHGVAWVLSRLGIGFDELVAVGDSENDAELLMAAGLGAVIADAPEGIRGLADFVTGSVTEDGVVGVIERFF